MAAIQALLDQSDEYEPNGELMDFARDTLFDFSRVKDPPEDRRGAARARPARCCGIASIRNLGVGRGGERAARAL